jgi:hypothetical protein
MPQIPKTLIELGIAVVIVFLIAMIIWLILQIIKAVRKNTPIPAEVFLDGSKRVPCFQSPIFSTMTTSQIIIQEAIKKIETSNQKLTENAILQTQLLERVAIVQEDMGKCVMRMDIRDSMEPRRG